MHGAEENFIWRLETGDTRDIAKDFFSLDDNGYGVPDLIPMRVVCVLRMRESDKFIFATKLFTCLTLNI